MNSWTFVWLFCKKKKNENESKRKCENYLTRCNVNKKKKIIKKEYKIQNDEDISVYNYTRLACLFKSYIV